MLQNGGRPALAIANYDFRASGTVGKSIQIASASAEAGIPTQLWAVRPGRTPAAVPGVVALPSLDDGSLSDVVLTVDTGLRRVEPRSGRPLWTLEGRDSGTVVLDGVVYQSGEAAVLRAVDGHSGPCCGPRRRRARRT